MTRSASRARLLDLRDGRAAARRGRDVLEQKLELLRRALQRRTSLRDERRAALSEALLAARSALRDAQVELGRGALESAALAQPVWGSLEIGRASLAGVQLPRLLGRFVPFRPRWGTGATAASLDLAGASFAATLPALLAAGEEESAVANLRRGLGKTARRLNALEKAILPSLEREIRAVAAALEEDERDESLRRERWIESGATRERDT